MTKYREIIRLTGLGFSQRNIMASCGVSQKTVVKVQKRARELNISWPLDESMTDTELQRLMFSKESKVSAKKRMPDYDYIRKELLRNGVSKKLLWTFVPLINETVSSLAPSKLILILFTHDTITSTFFSLSKVAFVISPIVP